MAAAMRYSIEDATVLHVKRLFPTLRRDACATIRAFGESPRASLLRAYRLSPYCRTALIEGRPVAMWGVVGAALSNAAEAWVALGDDSLRWPLSIARETKKELRVMAGKVETLYARVGRDDRRAMLFAVTMGFVPTEGCEDDRMALLTYGGGK